MSQPDDPSASLTRGELQSLASRGALWTLLHTLVSLPLAFGVNIILARVLGVEGFGRLAFLTAVLETTVVLVGLGISATVVQFGAKAHGLGRRQDVASLLQKSLGAHLLWMLPMTALVILVVPGIDGPYKAVAIVFGVGLPALFSNGPLSLTIENKTAVGAQVAMLVNLLMQVSVIGAALVLATPESVWVARFVAASSAGVIALFFVYRGYRRVALRPRWPRKFPRGFWPFALPTGASAILATLITTRSEVFLLQVFSDPVELGIYAFAFGLATHIFAPAQALVNPLIPAITSLREVDLEAIPRAFNRAVGTSATVVGLLVAAAVPPLALLIPTIYGPDFADAALLMVVLSVVSGAMVVTWPLQTFVDARLRAYSVLRANVGALSFGLSVGLVCVPLWGAWGAVCAKACAVGVRLLWLGLFELSSFGVSLKELVRSLTPLACAGTAALVAYAVGARFENALLGSVTSLVVGMLLVALLLRISGTGLTVADCAVVQERLPAFAQVPAGVLLRAVAHRRDHTTEGT